MRIKRGTEAIIVMQIDGYKKPVLMIQNGCVIRKVASFNNQDIDYTNYDFEEVWWM